MAKTRNKIGKTNVFRGCKKENAREEMRGRKGKTEAAAVVGEGGR